MNDYRITYTSAHSEEPMTSTVTERSEQAARKFFNSMNKGLGFTITGAELIRENTTATKDQEREALAKIRAIVEELGPVSYLRTAFDGCFEDAENNIVNDFADSWKARAEHYDAEMTEAQKTVVQLRGQVKSLEEALETAQNHLIKAQQRAIPSWLYMRLYNLTRDDLNETRERIRESPVNINSFLPFIISK